MSDQNVCPKLNIGSFELINKFQYQNIFKHLNKMIIKFFIKEFVHVINANDTHYKIHIFEVITFTISKTQIH